jgi:MFS family permease
MSIDTTVSLQASAQRLPILALLGANIISLIGSTLTMIALPWFVLQTTGSAAMTGLAGFSMALPGLVAGIFGGALIDRLGYKRVSVAADVISGIGIVLIPLLHDTIGLAFWQLLVLVFVGELLTIPGVTARRAMLPELAALAGIRLERVNGSFEAVQHLALLLGPPLAGLLIVWMGAGNVLWLDAASFAVSALIMALAIPYATPARAAAGRRYRDELVAGLQFLRRDRLLLALAISLGITNFFGNTLLAVILPVYTKANFGNATALGLMVSAFGAGALAGALLFGAIGHRLPRRAIWIGGFLVTPCMFWVLAAPLPLPIILGVLALVGLISGPITPLLVTIRHERIPTHLRGRVFSTFSAITQAASPLGIVVAGALIEGTGLRITILAIAMCAQLVGITMFFVPTFHAMNTAKHQAAR